MTQETTTQNDASANTETQQAQTGGTTHAEAQCTQADLDRRIGEARQKAADSTRKKLLAELEIDDPDTDKELLKAAKAKREADKSEVERAAGEAAKAKERADQLQAELDRERAERRIDARNRRILSAATEQKAQIPDDVLAWAEKNSPAELEKTLKDDGSVDDKAVQALVKACQTARPTWFGKGGVGSPSMGGGRSAQPGADAEKRSRQLNQSRIRG